MTPQDRSRIKAWEAKTGGFLNIGNQGSQGGGSTGAKF